MQPRGPGGFGDEPLALSPSLSVALLLLPSIRRTAGPWRIPASLDRHLRCAPAPARPHGHPVPVTSTEWHDDYSNQRLAAILRAETGMLVHLDRRAKPTIQRAAGCDAHIGKLIWNALLHGGTADLCQTCRRRCAALRGGCCSGLIPSCLGLPGPSVAELGSCMTAVSMSLFPMRPCGVQIV